VSPGRSGPRRSKISHRDDFAGWLGGVIQAILGYTESTRGRLGKENESTSKNTISTAMPFTDVVSFLGSHSNLKFMELTGDYGVIFLWALSGLRRLHFPRLTFLAIIPADRGPGGYPPPPWWPTNAWDDLGEVGVNEDSETVAERAASERMTAYWLVNALSRDPISNEVRVVPKFPAVKELHLGKKGRVAEWIDRSLDFGRGTSLSRFAV
jgi:hypothetical protein